MKTGRFFGFRDALLSKGYRVNMGYLKKAPPTYKGGYEAAMQVMKKNPKPRSIFVYNQIMAMGVVSAIRHLGCEIPFDVAVAGCDDSVDEREMLVPTTSVSFSFEETANLLLSLVDRRLKNPAAEPVTYRVSPKLIVRKSTMR
jgi:LacI family transcriptional regulator